MDAILRPPCGHVPNVESNVIFPEIGKSRLASGK
jgi:hypothetical protein